MAICRAAVTKESGNNDETAPKSASGRRRVGYVFAHATRSRIDRALSIAWSRAALRVGMRLPRHPLAIKGYDPVAYFTLQRATPGVAQFEYEWDEHRWQFANAQHRDLFKADPVRYAPQFENFCAVALARGEVREANPEYWLIIDGKLYLFGKAIGPDALSQGLQDHARARGSQPRVTAQEAVSAASGLGVQSRLAQPFAQIREIVRIQELVAVGRGVEHRIGLPDVFADARRVGGAADLRIGRRQHGLIEARARIPAQVELGLFDGFGVALLEVVRQRQREAVEVVELGIDAQRQLERSRWPRRSCPAT